MKRLPLLIVGAVAASATGLVLAVGGSAQGPPGKTIELREQSVNFTEVHNPPKGFSQGDEFVFRSKLTDTSGQRVGTDGGYCVITRASRHPVGECSVTLFLEDGKITSSGGVTFRGRKFITPVVGGTGAYEGAQGTLLNVQRTVNKADLTVTLLP